MCRMGSARILRRTLRWCHTNLKHEQKGGYQRSSGRSVSIDDRSKTRGRFKKLISKLIWNGKIVTKVLQTKVASYKLVKRHVEHELHAACCCLRQKSLSFTFGAFQSRAPSPTMTLDYIILTQFVGVWHTHMQALAWAVDNVREKYLDSQTERMV